MKIALAGNPNSGKTTTFNALTGKNEHVGNWAGVTVEEKTGTIKKSLLSGEEILAVDLPGAYSMSPFTSEEGVTSSYVKNEKPDVIINVVDATNLSRSLFFTTQLLELGIPVIVALNKTDINKKRKTKIDIEALSNELLCPVVKTVSTSGEGVKELLQKAVELKDRGQIAPFKQGLSDFGDRKTAEIADRNRFDYVNGIVKKVEKRISFKNDRTAQDRLDKILTNKWIGIPIFALVMFLVFFISQTTLGTYIADFITGYIDIFKEISRESLLGAGASPVLIAILIDGIIGGVGAVLGFLPLVMIMYFLLALLEDCGYMARVSVVLDPIFKRVGLSGKSVIPLIIGTGCAVPGIMASRTIKDKAEKRATAMLTPFIPCGAKIPLIALFGGAFFPRLKCISPVMYFIGILLVLFWGFIVKIISGYKYKKTFFIMEMPEYKAPSVLKGLTSMLDRGKEYIIKAGTVILVCNAAITIMASFDLKLNTASADHSILALIARPISVLFIPLGFGVWQLAAATISGFIAKEEVVGTIAAVYAIGENVINSDFEVTASGGRLAQMITVNGVPMLPIVALSYLAFNLFSPPCFAAIGAMNAEIKNKKWFISGILIQLMTGYVLSFLIYQIGSLVTAGSVGTAFTEGLIAVLSMMLTVVLIAVFKSRAFRKVNKIELN